MEEYRYKAFISYRHLSPDQDIAKRLHTLIENYGIPSSLKKSLGIQKMGRVFRDQEELPLSPDLGEDIHRALQESEWLVCICSPRYLESRWCKEELDYFISLGRKDHILTILAEGEPADSFPEQLRFETVDGVRIEKEPLAADVRVDNTADALKKLDNEKFRIMAPMLGVTYDDLKQRARQRRNRIYAMSAIAIIGLLSIFLAYAMIKNRQITDERNEALIAESKWLSKSAKEALDNNDRMLSLMLYLQALPEDIADPERPIIDEAGNGLISAIISSNATSTYSGVTQLDLAKDNGSIIDFQVLGNRMYLTRRGSIDVYDLDSGTFLKNLECEEGEIFGTYIRSDADFIVYHKDFLENHDAYSQTDIETYEESYQYEKGFDEEEYYIWKNVYTVPADYAKAVYGNGNWFHTENQSWKVDDRYFDNKIMHVHPTDASFIVVTYTDMNYDKQDFEHIYLIDKYNEIVNVYRYQIENSDYYGEVRDVIPSSDRKVFCGYSQHHLYFWNRNSAELFRTVEYDRFDSTMIEGVVAPSRSDYSFIAVLTKGGNIYLYDYVDDEVLFKLDNQSYELHSMTFNYDDNRILCAADRNKALIFSTADGSLIETLEAGFDVKDAFYGWQDRNGNAYSDNYIILADGSYGYKNDEFITRIQIFSTNTGNEAERFRKTLACNDYSMAAFSYDNRSLWLANGGSDLNINSELAVFDSESGNLIKTFEDYSSRIYQFEKNMISVPRTSDLSFSQYDKDPYVKIYDADSLEEVKTLFPKYEHIFGGNFGPYTEDAGMMFDRPFFSKEGEYMILQWEHGNVNYSEAFVYVYDTKNWQELWHIGLYNAYDRQNNSVMPETDDFDGDLYVYAYPAGKDKILVQYLYSSGNLNTGNQAFELRDAESGEILDKYVPDKICYFSYNEEDQVITLTSKDESLVFRTDDFSDISSVYEKRQETESDQGISYGGTIKARNNDLLLIDGINEHYILRVPSLSEAMQAAKTILNGRQLSDDQKEKYFLNK